MSFSSKRYKYIFLIYSLSLAVVIYLKNIKPQSIEFELRGDVEDENDKDEEVPS